MKRIIMFFLGFMMISVNYAQNIIPRDKIGSEMQNFYKHPDLALLTDLIFSMDKDSSYVNNPGAQPPAIGFFTEAFARYKDEYDTILNLANLLKYSKELVVFCLDLSKTPDTIVNWTGHDASFNDLHWGAYFASGDHRHLDFIISEMELCDNKDSLMLYLTGASAKWSLCSNAQQDPEVKEYIESVVDKVPAKLKTHVQEVLNSDPDYFHDKTIADVKMIKKKMEAAESGELCSIRDYDKNGLQIQFALIGDKNFFEEWKKPETPVINASDTYKRGDEIYPIIIFGTDGKDENGNANLTYDISIIKPGGSVYAHFDQLEIWKDAPVPVNQFYLVKQPVGIRIENNDPLGIYKIDAVIYENNKKEKVNLSLSFKVIE